MTKGKYIEYHMEIRVTGKKKKKRQERRTGEGSTQLAEG